MTDSDAWDAIHDVLELLLADPFEQTVQFTIDDRRDDLPVLFASAVGLLHVAITRSAVEKKQTFEATIRSLLDDLRRLREEFNE